MSNNDALVQRIVQIIQTHANPKQGLSNLKQNQNIVPGIVAIIKKSVGTNAAKVINAAPTNDVAKAITKLIQNSVKIPSNVVPISIQKLEVGGEPEVAVQVVKQANARDVASAITQLIKNSVKISSPVTVAAIPALVEGGQTSAAVQIIRQANARDVASAITQLIKNSVRIPPEVSAAAAAKRPSLFNRLGEMFSRKGKMPTYGPNVQPNFVEPVKTGVNNQGRNTYNQTPPMPGYVLTTRNGKTGWFRNQRVLNKSKKPRFGPATRPNFMEPNKNNQGRPNPPPPGYVLTTKNGKTGWFVNKPSVPPMDRQPRRRFFEPPRTENTEDEEFTRRRRSSGDDTRELMELMRRRRAAYLGGNGGGGGGGSGVGYGGGNGGGGGVPPLPTNQERAINNAGGVNKAMNTVLQVPGGAPEVAKAAEALNEAKGNTTYAIQVKGASPAAVNAVQKLGGSTNTIHVLEGLNTMSKTHATRKRMRETRRPKKALRPRVAELNRVLEAVKKQRLISLAAHNVTKTHNIHPNDEKLKKYYKKVLKANILRTPFAKIVRKAVTKKRG